MIQRAPTVAFPHPRYRNTNLSVSMRAMFMLPVAMETSAKTPCSVHIQMTLQANTLADETGDIDIAVTPQRMIPHMVMLPVAMDTSANTPCNH